MFIDNHQITCAAVLEILQAKDWECLHLQALGIGHRTPRGDVPVDATGRSEPFGHLSWYFHSKFHRVSVPAGQLTSTRIAQGQPDEVLVLVQDFSAVKVVRWFGCVSSRVGVLEDDCPASEAVWDSEHFPWYQKNVFESNVLSEIVQNVAKKK